MNEFNKPNRNHILIWLATVVFSVGVFYGLTNNRISNNEKVTSENKVELKELKQNIVTVLTEMNTRLSRIEGKIDK